MTQIPGLTIGSIILASDKTHLTNFSGDANVHAVYMTLGNIRKQVRAKISRRAWLLIAYIPSSSFPITTIEAPNQTQREGLPGILNRRLFHACMVIVTLPLRITQPHRARDPDGLLRLVIYIIMAYIADLEEQWMVAALGKNQCPHCHAGTKDLGSKTTRPTRTSNEILADIEKVFKARGYNTDPWSFFLEGKKYGLCGVAHPFWKGLPFGFDICQALGPEILHSCHKFFFDHPFKWNINTIGEKELDLRMIAQPNQVGVRRFPRGKVYWSLAV